MKAWQLPLFAVASVSTTAYAVQPDGILLGSGVTLLPGVEVSISDDSNIYLQENDETGSTITTIRPNVGLAADLGAIQLAAYYEVESASYDADSDDNYLDQNLILGSEIEMTSRQAISLDFSLKKGHDPRGSGSLEGETVVDPSEYTDTSFGGDYTYGADSAFANVTVYSSLYNKEYSNNESATDDLNYDKTTIGAELGLKVSSATRVLFELRNATLAYDTDTAIEAKDGSIMTLLAGASWDIAGKTTGNVKVGTTTRDFDGADVDSDSRFAWEAGITWSPKTYSVLNLTTSESAKETTGPGNYNANQFTKLSWDHTFSPRWALNAKLSLNKDNFVVADGDGDDRQDTTTAMGVEGIFSPNKMLDVTAGLEKSSRSSDASGLDYELQVLSVGLNLAF
ncbi:outer membrane beta-barrel protein [Oceanobacter sp. 4_MG-2023]|uniref:outer membrane beta-barrel protein n=1 Tax=Oceanobacter sp. 4_MG-2023 TaxID=3062623 RepID=UPI002736B653|nr:outer membrane beta-barrel protein [Oceanobacter sp. 4_MG-2023]MDP2548174.1 outer membrane beta-barrel protein [Oceanobacter sp. 4_MG-2023]